MRKVILFVFILLYLFGSICSAKEINPMNYEAIAVAETKMWQAYYQKNPEAVLSNLELYFGKVYGITNSELIKEVSEKFAVAYEKFGMMPQNSTQAEYNVAVVPLLTLAYQSLKNAISASWDPKQAAIADLSWMVARRQANMLNPDIVANKMVNLFYILYGKQDNNHFIRAAYLRAVAGRYRDQCQDMWGGVNNNDWQVINSLLEKTYWEISQGIMANNQK